MAKEKKEFDYKQASQSDLTQRLQKTQEELFKLRFRAASAPLKNTMEIRKLRRETARIQTFMNMNQSLQGAKKK